MWTEAVDLHSHTTYSDGVASDGVMAERAAKNGVKVWSLTDHDTAAGWDEAREEANRLGMRFIPQAWRLRVRSHFCQKKICWMLINQIHPLGTY